MPAPEIVISSVWGVDMWSYEMSPGDSKCANKSENHWSGGSGIGE